MSRGSTSRRAWQRNHGIPTSRKEKLRIALLGLIRIALEPSKAEWTAISTLDVLGIKPKKPMKLIQTADELTSPAVTPVNTNLEASGANLTVETLQKAWGGIKE